MNLPKLTIIYAVLLIILGLAGYFGLGMVSITALIPAFFGIVMLIVGFLAFKENLRRHAMHIASALGFIGFLATISSLPAFITLLGGGEVARPGAVVGKTVMASLSLMYFTLCFRSFVQARLLKKA